MSEVLTPAQASAADLRAIAETVSESIDLIQKHQGAFSEATLEPRLLIGCEISKAQSLFGMSNEDRARLGGETKAALVRRTKAEPNPLGFSAWLKKEIPLLNRSTARKYAYAFSALGIPAEETTPAKIRAKIKDRRHLHGKNGLPMPTLEDFIKEAKAAAPAPSKTLNIDLPKDTPELRLQDAREYIHKWKAAFDSIVHGGYLDDCQETELRDLKEFIAYARDRVNARLKPL